VNPIQAVLALGNIVAGIVLIAVSVPLIKRSIGPNPWYGFRISKAFQSKELWYDINEYGGRQLVIWAIPMILAGIVGLFIPMGQTPSPVALLLRGCGPAILFTMIPIVKTLLYARKR
jgi:hypothetical protein